MSESESTKFIWRCRLPAAGPLFRAGSPPVRLMPKVKITSFYRNTRTVRPQRGLFNGNFMSCCRVQGLTKTQPRNLLTPSILFGIPLSACGSFFLRVKSTFSISRRTRELQSIKSSASTHATYRSRRRWRGIYRALEVGDFCT